MTRTIRITTLNEVEDIDIPTQLSELRERGWSVVRSERLTDRLGDDYPQPVLLIQDGFERNDFATRLWVPLPYRNKNFITGNAYVFSITDDETVIPLTENVTVEIINELIERFCDH